MDRTTRARLALMLAHPFLASAIARLPLVDATGTQWCPTAATDGYYVYVNLAFAARLTDEDLGFVLAHEVLHCVLGHPDRRGSRERVRWNVAIDYATNALLAEAGLTPPKMALFDRRFAGMTAESIYDALPDDYVEVIRAGMQSVAAVSASGRGRRAAGKRPARRSEGSRPNPAVAEDDATRSVVSTHPGGSAGYDIHLDVGDPEGAALRAREFPSAEERQRLRTTLGRDLQAKLAGSAAGYWAAELEAGTERAVPWRELLARFVSSVRRSDYWLFPPHRKHLWRGLYMPSIGVPGPEHLVVAVDTSASMSDSELAQILGEVDELRAAFECRVTTIHCDTVIQHVEEYEPWDELAVPGGRPALRTAYGRGGTDLRPPFDWISKRCDATGELPDAIIYCTDGYGPFPAKPPDHVPALWIVTDAGVRTAPFGEIIRLPRVGLNDSG